MQPSALGPANVSGLLSQLDVAPGQLDQLLLACAFESSDLHRAPHLAECDGRERFCIIESAARTEVVRTRARPKHADRPTADSPPPSIGTHVDSIVISGAVGCKKPDLAIFDHACRRSRWGLAKRRSDMVDVEKNS